MRSVGGTWQRQLGGEDRGLRLDGRSKWRYRNRGCGSGTKAEIYHVTFFLPSSEGNCRFGNGSEEVQREVRCYKGDVLLPTILGTAMILDKLPRDWNKNVRVRSLFNAPTPHSSLSSNKMKEEVNKSNRQTKHNERKRNEME
jgi:hypothetical protein